MREGIFITNNATPLFKKICNKKDENSEYVTNINIDNDVNKFLFPKTLLMSNLILAPCFKLLPQ
jgi:hypothetical protein